MKDDLCQLHPIYLINWIKTQFNQFRKSYYDHQIPFNQLFYKSISLKSLIIPACDHAVHCPVSLPGPASRGWRSGEAGVSEVLTWPGGVSRSGLDWALRSVNSGHRQIAARNTKQLWTSSCEIISITILRNLYRQLNLTKSLIDIYTVVIVSWVILLPCLVTRSGNHGSSGQVRL